MMPKMISTPVSALTGSRWPCGNRTSRMRFLFILAVTRVPEERGPRRDNASSSFCGCHQLKGVRLLRLLGDTESQNMVTNNNQEQKFFLVDREQHVKRPVLIACGRTVVRAPLQEWQEECPDLLRHAGTKSEGGPH